MKRILAKIICAVLTLCVLCSGLVACGDNSDWKAGNLTNGGEIISQDGFIAESERYLYYINGSAANSSSNKFGDPVKGALMAVEKSSLATGNIVTEVVVPKIFSATNGGAGLFFDGGYVYYGTPNTEKNSAGAVAYDEMNFARTKLDGSGETEIFFNAGSHDVEYRFAKANGAVYVVYYDVDDQALISYNTTNKFSTTIAKKANDAREESLDAYKFIDGSNGAVVVYTTTVYAEPYNASEAEKTGYTRATENFNRVYVYKAGDVKNGDADVIGKKVLDGKGDAFNSATYTVTLIQNGFVFYKETPKTYAVAIADLLETGKEKQQLVKNETYVASANIIMALDNVFVLEDGVVYNTTLLELDGAIKKPVAKTGTISTLLFVDNAELYYYNSSSQLAKVTLKNVEGGADLNEEVNEVRVSEDTVSSAWFKPEIMKIDGKTYVFFLDNSATGNSYVKYVDVNGAVVEPEEDQTDGVYYLDGVKLLGKKTDEDFAKEITSRIENLADELVGGYLEFDDENAEVLTVKAVSDVKAIYDGASDSVKEQVSSEAKKVLNVYVKAIEITNKYNKLKGIENYNTTDHKAEDIPASIKSAFDQIKDDIAEYMESEDFSAVENYINKNYKFYYQQAIEFFGK